MIYVKSNDGVKIAVYDYNTTGKNTIFLVHGWPLSHKIFEYQLEALICEDFRVVAIDLRGFGQSDTPACNYSYDQMARDIYIVVQTLKLRNFVLTGFSMGGAIVLRYMRLFREYGVKKLILLSAAAPSWTQRPEYPFGLTQEYVNQLICLASVDRPMLAYTFSHTQLFACQHSQAVKDWFEDIALSASGIGTIQTAISLRDEDGRDDLSCVHVPTCILHGGKDVVVSNDLVHIQNEGISGSTLINIADSGHGIMYDELAIFNQYFLQAVQS